MKKISVLLIVLMAASQLFAQPSGPSGQMPKEGVLTGTIIDEETQQPVEYANIMLYSKRDSSMVDGGITDATGVFRLTKLPYGGYYLHANFIGYNKKQVADIRITPKSKVVDLGTVSLGRAEQALDEVDVVADRSRIEYKIDKKVVNVSQDLNSAGGSAVDVLENVPSVQVDIDGNVSLRGSSSFRVLINGKPTVLEGSDALQQIPSSSIENIEIITNPSAKYDPEGTAGIINIITKEKKKKGLNGVVNVSAGTNNKYNADFLLNYRIGKINYFIGADYSDRDFLGESNRYSETYFTDSTRIIDEQSNRVMHRDGYSIKGGFDYHIDDNSTLTLSAKMGRFDFGFDTESETHLYYNGSNQERYYTTDNAFIHTHDYYNATLSYQNFVNGDKNHTIESSLFYSGSAGDDLTTQEEIETDPSYNSLELPANKLRILEDGPRQRVRFKFDYTRPLGAGKLEAGYQLRYREGDEGYDMELFNAEDQAWLVQQELANTLTMYRHIQAAYSTYSGNFGDLGYMLGLRGEYTDRTITNNKIEEDYRIHRFDVFPSAHISYKLPAEQQLQVSYSRRLNRPRGWFLNPFENYQDPYSVRVGNPELSPEYTNSYELSYQKRLGMNFIALEGYYKQTDNEITRVSSLREEDGIMVYSFDNLNKETSMGMELMANFQVFKWWRLNASGNVYRYTIDGNVADEDVAAESNNWDMRMNNTFRFKNSRIQLMGFYNGPSVTAQGERGDFFFTSVAFRQDFLDRKASATLSVRDIFGTMKHDFTSETSNLYSEMTYTRESPVITLSLSYRINNYKDKRRPNGNEGSEYEGMGQM